MLSPFPQGKFPASVSREMVYFSAAQEKGTLLQGYTKSALFGSRRDP